MHNDWQKEFNASITIRDTDGVIIYMNDKSVEFFKKDGGRELIGKSLFDCHSEQSNKIIKELISEKKTNVYSIEKNGIKKIIYQTPFIENGMMRGIVEMILEIPFDMPHHVRS